MRSNVVTEILNDIIKMFPSSENLIIKLYESEDNFRNLCEDICDCKKMIHKYKKDLKRNNEYLKEYLELYDELLIDLRNKFEENIFIST